MTALHHTPGEIRFAFVSSQLSGAVMPIIVWQQLDDTTYIVTTATTSYDPEGAGKPASGPMLLRLDHVQPQCITLSVPTPVTEGRWSKTVGYTLTDHAGKWANLEPDAYQATDPTANGVPIMADHYRAMLERYSVIPQTVR